MSVNNDYGEEHSNLRGSRLWKQGDLLGAEKSFLASIERNPESDTGYGILAGFYLEQSELEKARSTLSQKRWKEEIWIMKYRAEQFKFVRYCQMKTASTVQGSYGMEWKEGRERKENGFIPASSDILTICV